MKNGNPTRRPEFSKLTGDWYYWIGVEPCVDGRDQNDAFDERTKNAGNPCVLSISKRCVFVGEFGVLGPFIYASHRRKGRALEASRNNGGSLLEIRCSCRHGYVLFSALTLIFYPNPFPRNCGKREVTKI